MSAIVPETTPVVIAVVVTGRDAEFARLLRSLEPVASDPNVHVLVLDNGEDDAVTAQVTHFSRRCEGIRAATSASRPRLPLHVARLELSAAVVRSTSSFTQSPIVWMIDDDLTFEEVRVDDGVMSVRNVAAARIASARALARTDIDILVSGFTGDPPVRPEAVLASQMIDLRAALRFAMERDPADAWTLASPYVRVCDDYYDHAELADWERPVGPVPWVPRGAAARTVGDQLRVLLGESCAIPRGCTPFRPLLARGDEQPVRVARADRGGNAIFQGVGNLLEHQYPAFPVGGRFSRRADMVGLNMLVRRGRVVVAKGDLTLRHDRTLQPRLTHDIEPWLAEFGGVLLSRVTSPDLADVVTPDALAAMAHRRADRIARSLDNGALVCQACLNELQDARAWWHAEPTLRASCEALSGELRHVSHVLANLRRGGLDQALRSADLQRRVWAAFTELRDVRT